MWWCWMTWRADIERLWMTMCRSIAGASATARSWRGYPPSTKLSRACTSPRWRMWANRSPNRRSITRTTSSREWRSSARCSRRAYGWSKLFLERILASFDEAYGMRFVALRYFNAAGATSRGEYHEPESHLVPNVLAAALGKKAHVSVFGTDYPTPDGTAIRDYVHVADLADAHILALAHLRHGGASDFLNLGTGDGYSVLQVIECARKVTGHPIPARMEAPRPGDPPRLVADAAKARRVLGWKPAQSDLSSILRSQWEWQKKFPRGYGPE